MTIYQEDIIIDHSKKPRNFGTLSGKHKISSVHTNFSCGDKIQMEIIAEKGIVKKIAFNGNACIMSMAASSLLTEYAKNKKKTDLITLDETFMINLLGITISPNRLSCIMVPLQALQKALQYII